MIEFPSLIEAERFIGQEVVITLQRVPTVCAVGTLLDLSEDGEARYVRPDGTIWRCWPVLAIEERHPVEG